MKIRKLQPTDDLNQISRVYEESWRHAYKNIIPQAFLDSIPEGSWVNEITDPDRHTLVCLENEHIVGTSSVCKSRFPEYPESGEVISIYFLPEYMHKGYGRKLMKAALDELKSMGFREVFLWVLEENAPARSFYEKYGFKCTNDYHEDNIGGKLLREVRYEFQL